MSKSNLLGLVANYGDSDEESDDGISKTPKKPTESYNRPPNILNYDIPSQTVPVPAGVHPAPITHCPWSACYDENSGFTYYWNQNTNAVTWEAPPEYLLALKLAQQQLHSSGATEVSAEEWQLYQQALAEKQNIQNKVTKPVMTKSTKKLDKPGPPNDKNLRTSKKRPASDEEEETIELITSYHNSDSESNDESEKLSPLKLPVKNPKLCEKSKQPQKKNKVKPKIVEYGPSLPPNQNYTIPIGPELPPELGEKTKSKSPETKDILKDEDTKTVDNDDTQDEDTLLKRLKDKAKLLEKLGGELPSELQKIIEDETKSTTSSPKVENNLDIDDLLEEIEKKELPKVKCKGDDDKQKAESGNESPSGIKTPPLEELKALYPNGNFSETTTSLFPSAANIDNNTLFKAGTPSPPPIEKEKKENVYLAESHEIVGAATRKKLRISNSVLPERKKMEAPAYTTKYSQFIEGFSTERTGLGFSKDENEVDSPKSTIKYGNGLTFTKGETLNEEKKDDGLEDLLSLVEAKLKYLNQLQPYQLTTIQEMFIQIQVIIAAQRAGALAADWASSWVKRANAALASHEAAAAPPGWLTLFQRSEGRYCYRRESDGFVQWEYPATSNTDMEICTTPPPPDVDMKEEQICSPEPSPWTRATPPPPGTETLPPSPPTITEPKKEIGDELMSFYNDIAELEKETAPNSSAPLPATQMPASPAPLPSVLPPPPPPRFKTQAPGSPETPAPPPPPEVKGKDIKMAKKKSKMKLSASLSMKNKSVSSLVAKWQQVAEEINSD